MDENPLGLCLATAALLVLAPVIGAAIKFRTMRDGDHRHDLCDEYLATLDLRTIH